MKKILGKNKKYGMVVCVITGIVLAALPAGCSGKEPVSLHSVDTAMGTVVVQRIYMEAGTFKASRFFKAEENYEESSLTEEILLEIQNMEAEKLSWRIAGSELAAVNASAGDTQGIALSEDMEDILGTCMEVSQASKGAFDITIGDVARLWNIDEWASAAAWDSYVLPEAEQIQEALSGTGFERLTLKEHRFYLPEGMSLDLGAVGKGIALTEIYELLEEKQVTGAVISVGGSVLTYGDKPDGTSWKVGIVDPLDTSRNVGILSLPGQWCVSTSGDYERFVEVDGVRYHHIMDPSTGYPADSGVKSVTILTKDGLLSDALSTACFILGEEEGSRLAESYHAEALFVDSDGNITMTDGMKSYFHLSNKEK